MALWVYILLEPPIQESEWDKRINNQLSFLSFAIKVWLNTQGHMISVIMELRTENAELAD